ncbi:hypothetical protein ACS0TY_001784 [Phlomoides rotata]
MHFDIKPLLDDMLIPKILNFGLAKVFSPEKNRVTLSAIRGIVGYVAPKLLNKGFGGVSYKVDVYNQIFQYLYKNNLY